MVSPSTTCTGDDRSLDNYDLRLLVIMEWKECGLKVSRYQRRRALSTMRKVNKAFHLPDPPFWYQRTYKDVEKALRSFFTDGKKLLNRVDLTYNLL